MTDCQVLLSSCEPLALSGCETVSTFQLNNQGAADRIDIRAMTAVLQRASPTCFRSTRPYRVMLGTFLEVSPTSGLIVGPIDHPLTGQAVLEVGPGESMLVEKVNTSSTSALQNRRSTFSEGITKRRRNSKQQLEVEYISSQSQYEYGDGDYAMGEVLEDTKNILSSLVFHGASRNSEGAARHRKSVRKSTGESGSNYNRRQVSSRRRKSFPAEHFATMDTLDAVGIALDAMPDKKGRRQRSEMRPTTPRRRHTLHGRNKPPAEFSPVTHRISSRLTLRQRSALDGGGDAVNYGRVNPLQQMLVEVSDKSEGEYRPAVISCKNHNRQRIFDPGHSVITAMDDIDGLGLDKAPRKPSNTTATTTAGRSQSPPPAGQLAESEGVPKRKRRRRLLTQEYQQPREFELPSLSNPSGSTAMDSPDSGWTPLKSSGNERIAFVSLLNQQQPSVVTVGKGLASGGLPAVMIGSGSSGLPAVPRHSVGIGSHIGAPVGGKRFRSGGQGLGRESTMRLA